MRILLFLGTNAAILVVISLIFQLFGIERYLVSNGVNLDLNGLLLMSAIFGFAGSLISLFASKFMAKRSMGVQLITQPSNATERWLVSTVEQQAQKAGIGMPEVGVFEGAPNAFATGWNRNDALVAVSTGLLHQMNQDEIEAVLAHEVSHVANGDMVTLTLIQGIVNTFVIFFSRIIGHTVDKLVFKSRDGFGPGYFITSIIAQMVLSFLATMIVMWFSRWREYRADAGGAALSSRHKMISALQRLKQTQHPEEMPEDMAAFGISGGKMSALFASHPPLDDRIAALQRGA